MYLDSAATSQKPQCVLDAMNKYYLSFCANSGRGSYPWANKSTKIIETTLKGDTADTLPSSEIFVANNYLLTARYFPGFDAKGATGQKMIMDYYFPLFKKDYDQLKFACVDNAISQLTSQGVDKDSARIQALESSWRQYPDTAALRIFRSRWDTYHKNFIKSLPDGYYRFVDADHIR